MERNFYYDRRKPDETEDCKSLQQSLLSVLLVLVVYATSQAYHLRPAKPVLRECPQTQEFVLDFRWSVENLSPLPRLIRFVFHHSLRTCSQFGYLIFIRRTNFENHGWWTSDLLLIFIQNLITEFRASVISIVWITHKKPRTSGEVQNLFLAVVVYGGACRLPLCILNYSLQAAAASHIPHLDLAVGRHAHNLVVYFIDLDVLTKRCRDCRWIFEIFVYLLAAQSYCNDAIECIQEYLHSYTLLNRQVGWLFGKMTMTTSLPSQRLHVHEDIPLSSL